MSFPTNTTGLGVAAKILTQGNVNPGNVTPGYNGVRLSLSGVNGPTSFQLNPQVVDVAGNPVTLGTAYVLTAVAASSPGSLTLTSVAASANGDAVYTGSFGGGASNAYQGSTFTVAGFTNASNNGAFICIASAAGSITLVNANAVAETHAATAVDEESTAVYTGTFANGGSNALAGTTFAVAGFTNATNNGSFIATASSTTTITVVNYQAVAETHAATATAEEGTNALTYVAYGFKNSAATPPNGAAGSSTVTVSATGLVSTNGVEGGSVVEVSFPTFNNTEGATGAVSPNPMHGLPKDKIYSLVNVKVVS